MRKGEKRRDRREKKRQERMMRKTGQVNMRMEIMMKVDNEDIFDFALICHSKWEVKYR